MLGANVLMMMVELGLCVWSFEALLTRNVEGWYFACLNVPRRFTTHGVGGMTIIRRRRRIYLLTAPRACSVEDLFQRNESLVWDAIDGFTTYLGQSATLDSDPGSER